MDLTGTSCLCCFSVGISEFPLPYCKVLFLNKLTNHHFMEMLFRYLYWHALKLQGWISNWKWSSRKSLRAFWQGSCTFAWKIPVFLLHFNFSTALTKTVLIKHLFRRCQTIVEQWNCHFDCLQQNFLLLRKHHLLL